MSYLAHISEDNREQTVLEHLEGTAELCSEFAKEFGAEELGKFAGLAHDLGKYSAAFQKRLQGGPKVDHSTAGAYECHLRGQNSAAFCVAGHHGGLPNVGGKMDAGTSTFFGRISKAKKGNLESYTSWKQELELPPAKIPDFLKNASEKDKFFFTKMLYSCLVDADYLDTERFMAGKAPERGNSVSMETLYKKLEKYISGWFPPKGELNTLRCNALEKCIQQAKDKTPGLFTLTIPTGGGKTVSSLAFALRHAKEHKKKRVIYVIPYTSIIEQTAGIFRDILGEENVLEHHSNVIYDMDSEGEATPEAEKMLRATENWDMPVIVTTAVQFFESLYSNRSSQCRKLHNIANSVIIFDEAQMMPLPYLRPCVLSISQLVAHYGVSAVLCTATQPALSPIFESFLPGIKIPELCEESIINSQIFKRVRFENAGRLSWEELNNRLQSAKQVLCIVNSRKNAKEIFEGIRGEGNYHLSTLMTPSHRKEVLAKIRQRLKDDLPCRVISTSLIEAGVDVDFPLVFREESGLDSILQAAGRCNREGKRPRSESVVTIFKAQNRPPEIFGAAIAAGKEAIEKYEDLSSPEAISCYFSSLLDLSGGWAQDQKGILSQINEDNLPFRKIAEDFHLIEEDTTTIYIPKWEGEELVTRLRQGERSRELFRALGRCSVSVYKNQFDDLNCGGALEKLEDGSYILIDPSRYLDDTGLSTEVNDTGLSTEANIDSFII